MHIAPPLLSLSLPPTKKTITKTTTTTTKTATTISTKQFVSLMPLAETIKELVSFILIGAYLIDPTSMTVFDNDFKFDFLAKYDQVS